VKKEQLHIVPKMEPDDPGRILLHASLYVWNQARQYSLNAWLEAVEILRRARNDYEDEDRIEFGKRLEELERTAARQAQSRDDVTLPLALFPRPRDCEQAELAA
jgi:hypothetical protein